MNAIGVKGRLIPVPEANSSDVEADYGTIE